MVHYSIHVMVLASVLYVTVSIVTCMSNVKIAVFSAKCKGKQCSWHDAALKEIIISLHDFLHLAKTSRGFRSGE